MRRGQVKLVCVETFYEEAGEGVSKRSSEQYVEEMPFFGREHVLKGMSYSESFKFLIPDKHHLPFVVMKFMRILVQIFPGGWKRR